VKAELANRSSVNSAAHSRRELQTPRLPGIWAVVPIKRLAVAKQRLAAALGGAREEFAYLLMCRTLDVLRKAALVEGVIVVSPDKRVAQAARDRGAVVVDDGEIPLNDACALGLAAAAGRGSNVSMLMPCDLAALTAKSLTDVIHRYFKLCDRYGPGSIGLVRCKDGTGTNMILLGSQMTFRPSFGPNSFERHRQDCAGAARELIAPAVSFDIDSPGDIEAYARMVAGIETPDALANLVRGLAEISTTAPQRDWLDAINLPDLEFDVDLPADLSRLDSSRCLTQLQA
jgi:2-phospho-L-lactate guanylyltransferase